MTPAIGTRVVGVWGAMFPEYHGTVVGHNDKGTPLVEWDDWCESPGQHPFQVDRGPSPAGSLVGVWTREGLQSARAEIRQRNERRSDARTVEVQS